MQHVRTLLKDRVDRMLGDFKDGHPYTNSTITLNTLWTYSKGYVDLVNFETDSPFVMKFGYVIDAPAMPAEEFARLVNARLVRDKLPYYVQIYTEYITPQLVFGSDVKMMAYILKVFKTKGIALGDQLVEALAI